MRMIRSRRLPRCAGCWLPLALCLCAELPRLRVRTRLVVVMHRREAITSSNTGRLAVRSIEGAWLRVRGRIEDAEQEPLPEGRRLALFPGPFARVLGPGDAQGEPLTLLVPDGSWTQARKLARRDEDLSAAEAVALPPSGSSRYGLRRSPGEDRLCTLEAIARALGILEGPEVEAALLLALDRFVERTLVVRERGSAFAGG
jgi:DTW domain-containing protein